MYQVSEKTSSIFASIMANEDVQKALAFIEEDERKTLDEQKEIVLVEAPTFHEEARAKLMLEKFKSLGLEDVHIDRGGNVVATRKGSVGGMKILVEGHLDTVFPFGTVTGVEEKDGYIYAPGIGDDTRALAMELCAIRALNHAGIKTVGDIIFVATSREEGAGSLGGMKDFIADNKDIDMSINIDNHDMGALVFNGTYSETYEIVFKGIGGHAFTAFGTMAQPLHAAARAVAAIAQLNVPTDPKTTFCVSNFHSGTDAGVHAIAPEATIKINFRSNAKAELDSLREKIFKAIDDGAKEESAKWGKDTITWEKTMLGNVPGGEQSPNMPLVEAAYCALKELGIEPEFTKGGGTNANIAISNNIPAVCIGRAFTTDEESKLAFAHSTSERYPTFGSYKSVQEVLMVLLMAAGLDGVSDSVMK